MSKTSETQIDELGFGPFDIGPDGTETELEEAVWMNLDEIPDPHLPLSLVEMAMIYDVSVDRDGVARVDLSFPCMGCPAYEFIHDDIRGCLRTMDGVTDVEIDVVWDPVWSKDMLDEHAREELRESGIAL
ncbi:metal-sulfur cluster assembly factor [Halomicroarcula limicola]|uniref:Metal-sulfur cluster assembly factor n=1 Tax=Haloarcula limicola TaxID=1429915 RepID=A0A8J8C691_9EURY|nr:metal-sulfur cluster assembly factor [Halomicroarcula limicola]MBV0925964.1 metal-sulfur cluster assembly factor [Halomicroarcula limicola]